MLKKYHCQGRITPIQNLSGKAGGCQTGSDQENSRKYRGTTKHILSLDGSALVEAVFRSLSGCQPFMVD